MNKILTAAFSLLLLSNVCHAEAGKYLVVDIEKVIYSSEAAANLRKSIEESKNKYQEDIHKQESALKKEEEKLKAEQKKSSQEAFEKKVRDFQLKVAEMQRGVQIKRSNLEEAFEESMGKISEKASEIVADIAKDRKAELVFPSSRLLYSESNLDVTDEVAKRLNSELKKVDFKVKK